MARLDAEAANSDVEELIWSSNTRSSAGSESCFDRPAFGLRIESEPPPIW